MKREYNVNVPDISYMGFGPFHKMVAILLEDLPCVFFFHYGSYYTIDNISAYFHSFRPLSMWVGMRKVLAQKPLT